MEVKKKSTNDPMPPESQCYFDIAHRLDETFNDLDKDAQSQLIAMLRALLDNVEQKLTMDL